MARWYGAEFSTLDGCIRLVMLRSLEYSGLQPRTLPRSNLANTSKPCGAELRPNRAIVSSVSVNPFSPPYLIQVEEEGPRPEARPWWWDYKAGLSAGMSLEGSSWTARSSLAIRMARTSHARTFVLAPLFLPRPVPFFSISRERR